MDLADAVRAYVVVGYVLIVVFLPRIVFAVRRTGPTFLFVASLWFVIAGAVQTNAARWGGSLVLSDVLRVAGVTLFFAYLGLRYGRRSSRRGARA